MTRARTRRTGWGKVKKLPSERYWAGEPLGGGKYRPAPETFTSRSAAEKWLRQRELERDGERAIATAAKTDATFGWWLDLWLSKKTKAFNAGRMSGKGYSSVEGNSRLYVRRVTVDGKSLLDIPIRKIDTTMIEKIQECLRTMPGHRVAHSPESAHKAELNIYSVCKLAAAEGAIPVNPWRSDDVYVSNYDPPRNGGDFELSTEMVDAIIEEMPIEYRAVIFLWAYTGLRAGEAWGTQVRDLNLLHRRVAISRQLVSGPDHLIKDPRHFGPGEALPEANDTPWGARIRKGVELRPPKPKRAKTLDLLPFVLPEIEAHLERRQAEYAYDWLFVDHNGLPVNHGNWYAYVFKPICRKLDLPDSVDVHTLRHFCGSYLLGIGFPWFVVQTQLDHTNEEMTKRYAHMVPGLSAKWHDLAEAEYAGRQAK